jgi:purine-nucleoside phosphorylase
MKSQFDQIQESLAFLLARVHIKPRFGLILGTGMGNLSEAIVVDAEIPYASIPHFPVSTVQGHKGSLIFGWLEGIPVVCMAGRFHYYEGFSMQQLTFPVRVLKFLGIERLFITNACGGLRDYLQAGDLVFLRDHINLQGDNPLRGGNDERLGPRFPDMLHTYDRTLNARALQIASANEIRAFEGVYIAIQGPNLETPAEYKFMAAIGADVVGMSTVPEVLVAKHMGLPVFVASVVANQGFAEDYVEETTLEDVIAMVASAEPKLRKILTALMQEANEGNLP